MSVLEGEKKPEPKPVEPVIEKKVNDEDVNMVDEACHIFSQPLILNIIQ